jgi:hypothetical protein
VSALLGDRRFAGCPALEWVSACLEALGSAGEARRPGALVDLDLGAEGAQRLRATAFALAVDLALAGRRIDPEFADRSVRATIASWCPLRPHFRPLLAVPEFRIVRVGRVIAAALRDEVDRGKCELAGFVASGGVGALAFRLAVLGGS